MKESYTLAYLKPGYNHLVRLIREELGQRGFDSEIVYSGFVDEGFVRQFYAEHLEKPFFPELLEYTVSGKIIAFVIYPKSGQDNPIEFWRKYLGDTNPIKATPESLRARFGESKTKNVAHGSDSPKSAQRELILFLELT